MRGVVVKKHRVLIQRCFFLSSACSLVVVVCGCLKCTDVGSLPDLHAAFARFCWWLLATGVAVCPRRLHLGPHTLVSVLCGFVVASL